jgi:hypothetical protein
MQTKGLCTFCFKWVDAFVVNKNNGEVFLQKLCPEHGISEILLSRHAEYFISLRDFYFKTHSKIFRQNRYLLFLTPRCNLSCPICFLGPKPENHQDIEVIDLAREFKDRNKELILFGAEPTCHNDLIGVIEYLKKKQHTVSLYTNGIKLCDFEYAMKLKKSGVDKIYFQFDGFNDEAYEILRKRQLLENKTEVLKNLKNLNIPVVLDVTVAKDVNHNEIGRIFDFALENKFIKAINFIAYVRSGRGRDYLNNNSLMPDEIIDYVVTHTKGRISREHIYKFQKLLYVYMSLLNLRTCFYIQYFWLYRQGESEYMPLEEIINLDALEKILDKYVLIKERKGDSSALIFLITNIPRFISAIRNYRVFWEWIIMTMSHISRSSEYANKSNNFLQLIFSTACDHYKADLKIAERCHVGIIYKDDYKRISIKDENSLYLLNK